jgi:hypothetical protein
MSVTYFWKDGEVITVNGSVMQQQAENLKLLYMYCVDTLDIKATTLSYGMFVPSKGWIHFPLETFPKEFRAWLLINL